MYIVYFLCILLFGSFYLINLVLAVVAISYEQEVLGGNGDKDNAVSLRLTITLKGTSVCKALSSFICISCEDAK